MPSREAPIRLPVTKIVSQWRKSFGDPPFVISSPSTMLRTGSARNLRSLTFVRDDNATFRDCYTVSCGREKAIWNESL